MIQILPSITNISGSWKNKIKEIKKLGITEVALFLSCFEPDERKLVYRALEKTKLKSIPFVHARHDTTPDEYEYLIKRWHTKVFNLHFYTHHFPIYDLSKYNKYIYLENNPGFEIDLKRLKQYAGLCVDFAHLEEDRLSYPKIFKRHYPIIQRYRIGCGHISAVKTKKQYDPYSQKVRHDFHWLSNLSELDYLKRYPIKLFPRYIAIELENSIAEQLKVKGYIEKILKEKSKNVKIAA